MRKWQTYNLYKSTGVQSLCRQHTPLCQGSLDLIFTLRAPFIHPVWDAYWASPDRTSSQILQSWRKHNFPPCTLSLSRDKSTRWVMFAGWMMVECQRTSSNAELMSGKRPLGHPPLCYKDVCKQDSKSFNTNPATWEVAAQDHYLWQQILRTGQQTYKTSLTQALERKRKLRKQKSTIMSLTPLAEARTCDICPATPKLVFTATKGTVSKINSQVQQFYGPSRLRWQKETTSSIKEVNLV